MKRKYSISKVFTVPLEEFATQTASVGSTVRRRTANDQNWTRSMPVSGGTNYVTEIYNFFFREISKFRHNYAMYCGGLEWLTYSKPISWLGNVTGNYLSIYFIEYRIFSCSGWTSYWLHLMEDYFSFMILSLLILWKLLWVVLLIWYLVSFEKDSLSLSLFRRYA